MTTTRLDIHWLRALRDAENLLRDWRGGRHFTTKAVRKAHAVLDLPYDGSKR